MNVLTRSVRTQHSPQAVFDVVAGVAAYPEFVPWCREAHIKVCSGNAVEATLVIVKGPFNLSFTTYNQMHAPEYIEMCLVKGPFQRFRGRWSFEPLLRGSLITLRLEFVVDSRSLNRMMMAFFRGGCRSDGACLLCAC